jgi:hypothetical protein
LDQYQPGHPPPIAASRLCVSASHPEDKRDYHGGENPSSGSSSSSCSRGGTPSSGDSVSSSRGCISCSGGDISSSALESGCSSGASSSSCSGSCGASSSGVGDWTLDTTSSFGWMSGTSCLGVIGWSSGASSSVGEKPHHHARSSRTIITRMPTAAAVSRRLRFCLLLRCLRLLGSILLVESFPFLTYEPSAGTSLYVFDMIPGPAWHKRERSEPLYP